MSLQHIQKNSPRLLPKPAKFEKNPLNGYRVIRKTKCGAGGAGGARSSPIHKQASLAGRLINKLQVVHIPPPNKKVQYKYLSQKKKKLKSNTYTTPNMKEITHGTTHKKRPHKKINKRKIPIWPIISPFLA